MWMDPVRAHTLCSSITECSDSERILSSLSVAKPSTPEGVWEPLKTTNPFPKSLSQHRIHALGHTTGP